MERKKNGGSRGQQKKNRDKSEVTEMSARSDEEVTMEKEVTPKARRKRKERRGTKRERGTHTVLRPGKAQVQGERQSALERK